MHITILTLPLLNTACASSQDILAFGCDPSASQVIGYSRSASMIVGLVTIFTDNGFTVTNNNIWVNFIMNIMQSSKSVYKKIDNNEVYPYKSLL